MVESKELRLNANIDKNDAIRGEPHLKDVNEVVDTIKGNERCGVVAIVLECIATGQTICDHAKTGIDCTLVGILVF